MLIGNHAKRFGQYILLAYLVSSLIGKSYLEYTAGVWRLYQIFNVICSVLLAGWAIWEWRCNKMKPEDFRLPQRIHVTLVLFILWGFLTCIWQRNAIDNLIPFTIYAGMIVFLVFLPFRYLQSYQVERFLLIITIVISVSAIACLLAYVVHFPPLHNGRLRGVYNNPLTCANMMLINIILLFWCFLRYRHKRLSVLVICFLCLVVIILTRSRSAYIEFCVLLVVVILHRMAHVAKYKQLVFLVMLLLAIGAYGGLGFISRSQIAEAQEYARVEGGMNEVAMDRYIWWEGGLKEDLRLGNIFGKGFLGAYGWGIGSSDSGYNIEMNRHNTFLTCAQSYGIVGLSLWCILVCLMFYRLWHNKSHMSTLGFMTLFYSVMNGMISNHLLGFGSPPDRFSWFLIGIALNYSCYKKDIKK